jgi:hypothetical protein
VANRNDILKCLGTFPKKINLSLKELTSEDMGDHERKLIEYTVEKCDEKIRVQNNDIIEKVQAYVLVGLTNDEMYSYGLDLVKQGYEITSLQFNE